MKRSERARLSRMTLDFRYQVGGADALANRPARGWIRAVRDALGMTGTQLAERMGISQPALAQLERSEAAGVIQLDSLRRAAEALDCDLVYALVPRTSLEEMVERRSQDVARRRMAAVDVAIRRDRRQLDGASTKRLADEHAAELIASGRLWDDPEPL